MKNKQNVKLPDWDDGQTYSKCQPDRHIVSDCQNLSTTFYIPRSVAFCITVFLLLAECVSVSGENAFKINKLFIKIVTFAMGYWAR